MMKNKFLFLMILGWAFFASCSDDDKDPFKNYSADYSGDKLALKLNGKEFSGTSVSFNSINKKNATLTLNGLIPGESALEVKNLAVEELTGNDYTFAGENKNDDRIVSVEGSVKSGVLNLNTSFKVTPKVVGKWHMTEPKMNENTYEWEYSPLVLNIDTDVESLTFPLVIEDDPNFSYSLPMKDQIEEDGSINPGFPTLAKTIFGMMIPNLLKSIELKENGNLVATYIPLNLSNDAEEDSQLLVTEEGLVRYNVKDGQIYLLIDIASLVDMNSFNGRSDNTNDALMTMLTIGIPLKLDVNDSKLIVSVDKDMMMPFMAYASVLKGMVENMETIPLFGTLVITSTSLQKFIDDIVVLVTTARSMELGLDLVPYVEEYQPQASLSLSEAIEKTVIQFEK